MRWRLAAAFQKLLDPGMMDNVARQAERNVKAVRVDAYEAEGLEQEKRQVEKEIDRLIKFSRRPIRLQMPLAFTHSTSKNAREG
jgi:hypothetical protein